MWSTGPYAQVSKQGLHVASGILLPREGLGQQKVCELGRSHTAHLATWGQGYPASGTSSAPRGLVPGRSGGQARARCEGRESYLLPPTWRREFPFALRPLGELRSASELLRRDEGEACGLETRNRCEMHAGLAGWLAGWLAGAMNQNTSTSQARVRAFAYRECRAGMWVEQSVEREAHVVVSRTLIAVGALRIAAAREDAHALGYVAIQQPSSRQT